MDIEEFDQRAAALEREASELGDDVGEVRDLNARLRRSVWPDAAQVGAELDELREKVNGLERAISSGQDTLRVRGLDVVDHKGRVRIHVGSLDELEDFWHVELRSIDGSGVSSLAVHGDGGDEDGWLTISSASGDECIMLHTRFGEPRFTAGHDMDDRDLLPGLWASMDDATAAGA
jgi:hypothetical protein